MQRKEQGFAKIAFKSKKNAIAATGPAPASFAANVVIPQHDKKVEAAAPKKEDDVCMQSDPVLVGSPAENTEKVPLSPLTWINPASETANAPHSGNPHVEESSREPSNLARGEQKYESSAQNERDAEML